MVIFVANYYNINFDFSDADISFEFNAEAALDAAEMLSRQSMTNSRENLFGKFNCTELKIDCIIREGDGYVVRYINDDPQYTEKISDLYTVKSIGSGTYNTEIIEDDPVLAFLTASAKVKVKCSFLGDPSKYSGFNVSDEHGVLFDDKTVHNYLFKHGKKLSDYTMRRLATDFPLEEAFMDEYADRLDFNLLCCNQVLSEDFMRRHQDRINWDYTSETQKLSYEFIEEFSDKLNWTSISIFQELDTKFLLKHKDKIDWSLASEYQKFNIDFIKKNPDLIDFNAVIYNKKCDRSVKSYVLLQQKKKSR